MLIWLAQWLQGLQPDWTFLRVVQYITFRAVMAAMTALLIGLWIGPKAIRMLTALKSRPAHSRLRHANAFGQKRHAHHGRGADFVVDCRLHPAVV